MKAKIFFFFPHMPSDPSVFRKRFHDGVTENHYVLNNYCFSFYTHLLLSPLFLQRISLPLTKLHVQPLLFLFLPVSFARPYSLQFKSSPWTLWDSSLHIYCAAVWYSCELFLSARHWSSAPVCSRGYRTRSHFHKGPWQGFSSALIGPVLGSLASSTLIDHFVFPQDSVTPSSYQAPCTSPCPDPLWEKREEAASENLGANILIAFPFLPQYKGKKKKKRRRVRVSMCPYLCMQVG